MGIEWVGRTQEYAIKKIGFKWPRIVRWAFYYAILILIFLVFFISLNDSRRFHIAIPILASIIILTHPVSLFFVLSIFIIYLFYNLKSNFGMVIFHGLLFS